MENQVIFSIQPKYCLYILQGNKNLEVRKRLLKVKPPFKGYIYCTYGTGLMDLRTETYLDVPFGLIEGTVNSKTEMYPPVINGKVIAEFTCDKICEIKPHINPGGYCDSYEYVDSDCTISDCLTYEELNSYLKGKTGYGYHIIDLKIYEKPKPIENFLKPCIWPRMPYCPDCPKGYEYISEDEAEAYRLGEGCSTEWICLNRMCKAPQSMGYTQGYTEK